VVVEAFRGFRDRQEFDVSASAVVLAGPNGTGKTSFFDALQWCLLGAIQRLEGLRARKNVEHIVNQYRLSERAAVEVDMLVRGRSFTIRRTGDYSGSTLEFRAAGSAPIFGAEAESALADALVPGDGLTLDMALSTSGLMQQDVMRAVLEAKPADRYRHISTVLGLGALEDFEEAARELAKEAKAQADAARADRDAIATSLEQARGGVVAAEQRLQALPQVDVLRAEVASLLGQAPDGLSVDVSVTINDSEDIRGLVAETSELIEALESFSEAWQSAQRIRTSLAAEPSAEAVSAAAAGVEAAQQTLVEARERSNAARSRLDAVESATADMVRLAALAIPMLSEECPVCGQSIDAAHVERELRGRSGETSTILAARAESDEAELQLRAAEVGVGQASDALQTLESQRARWSQYRTAEQRASDLAGRMLEHQGRYAIAFANATDLARGLPETLEFLRATRRRSLEVVDTLEQRVDRGQVERASSEVSSFTEALGQRAQRLEEASQRAQLLKALADASVAARVEVTEQRFKAVQPLVADIFSRLDPHPAFKTIEFELDTYYRRGTTSPLVRDLVEGVTADPLVVFSTSQANIAALSYFLAMGWSAGDRTLPFVLLDDPVQSMDDVNVLGFADLCRHLRTSRQLIISTHERRFARLLERKLAPRSESYTTRVLEFVGWDRSGPAVQARTVESQLLDGPIRVVQAAS
jgi:DNA repair exonuclease SbcCD ATPase subunit